MVEQSREPERKTELKEEVERAQSSRPENWPGIPGRSQEHEATPDSPAHDGDAQVTRSQRELERDVGERQPQR